MFLVLCWDCGAPSDSNHPQILSMARRILLHAAVRQHMDMLAKKFILHLFKIVMKDLGVM